MTWSEQAAPALAAAYAAAAIDRDGTTICGHPADTVELRRFEIGSVTKTMTATILSLLAGEGVLDLEDPIGRWLSAGDNGTITIGQLATHTSGLPRLAPNVTKQEPRRTTPGPGSASSKPRRDCARPRRPPTAGSNLGYQLLALVLQRAADRPFQNLLTERLLTPLAMTASVVGSRDDGLLLLGHNNDGPVGPKTHPLGAGGIETTIGDLARYARACLFPEPTPLGAALTHAQTPLLDLTDGTRQALAWIVRDGEIREHSGGTPGFTACVSVDPDHGRAVALPAATA